MKHARLSLTDLGAVVSGKQVHKPGSLSLLHKNKSFIINFLICNFRKYSPVIYSWRYYKIHWFLFIVDLVNRFGILFPSSPLLLNRNSLDVYYNPITKGCRWSVSRLRSRSSYISILFILLLSDHNKFR